MDINLKDIIIDAIEEKKDMELIEWYLVELLKKDNKNITNEIRDLDLYINTNSVKEVIESLKDLLSIYEEKTTTLYGVDYSCKCGCTDETYIFTDRDKALDYAKDNNKRCKVIALLNCENLFDGRYIYEDTVIKLGYNNKRFNIDYPIYEILTTKI